MASKDRISTPEPKTIEAGRILGKSSAVLEFETEAPIGEDSASMYPLVVDEPTRLEAPPRPLLDAARRTFPTLPPPRRSFLPQALDAVAALVLCVALARGCAPHAARPAAGSTAHRATPTLRHFDAPRREALVSPGSVLD